VVALFGVTIMVGGAVADGGQMVSATEKALINTLETRSSWQRDGAGMARTRFVAATGATVSLLGHDQRHSHDRPPGRSSQENWLG